MEVIDSDSEVHISWFRLVDGATLPMRVAFEEFYHDHFLEHEIFMGYSKYEEGKKPDYMIGTNELIIIDKLLRMYDGMANLYMPDRDYIICIH